MLGSVEISSTSFYFDHPSNHRTPCMLQFLIILYMRSTYSVSERTKLVKEETTFENQHRKRKEQKS